MGSGGFSSIDYDRGVDMLRSTGKTFARSATARATGDFSKIAAILNPRKLKNGIRECCYAPGFNDVLPVVVALDGTGSMQQVPADLQKRLPELIGLITSKNIADHPNVLFMCFDDEHATPPDAAFQMSQFEAEAPKLLEALNEMVIPGNGGGNNGEAYHLAIYGAAYHTKLESFDKNGEKGFFFLVGDEQPYYDAQDPKKYGTTPEMAKTVFGDKIEETVTMLTAMKELAKRYHIFVIRPGNTSHGKDRAIGTQWQNLLEAAGENRQNVLSIEDTEAIVPTMALTIGSVLGADRDELVDVLRTSGVAGVEMALVATKNVAAKGAVVAVGKASGALATAAATDPSRKRRR
jgi:hypothetical protein